LSVVSNWDDDASATAGVVGGGALGQAGSLGGRDRGDTLGARDSGRGGCVLCVDRDDGHNGGNNDGGETHFDGIKYRN